MPEFTIFLIGNTPEEALASVETTGIFTGAGEALSYLLDEGRSGERIFSFTATFDPATIEEVPH